MTLRAKRLLDCLKNQNRVSVIIHDNPDPDAMAAAWAIQTLLEIKADIHARILARGVITRAENVRFMSLLNPPVKLIDKLPRDFVSAVIMVDCNPSARNHLVAGTGIKPLAVIDHHRPAGPPFRVPHRDIRAALGATSTIAASYLMEEGIKPSPDLATALIYALRSDATGVSGAFTKLDITVLDWLNDFADQNKLNEIENAPLSQEYFTDLACALQNTFVYDNTAICFLPFTSGPEIVGEVADLLVRSSSIDRVFCAAAFGDSIIISVRTDDQGGDAAALLRKTLEEIPGYCGGHAHRAGGKIVEWQGSLTEDRESLLRRRWLSACSVDEKRGKRLVARKTILNSL